MKCFYCFGDIEGDPHIVRGRAYHPPRMVGNRALDGSGCADKDKPQGAAIYRPASKVSGDQLRLI